jgi:DNA-binding NarL/FixJ family response regulator
MQNRDGRQVDDSQRESRKATPTATAQPNHSTENSMTTIADPTKAITPRQLELLAEYASGYDIKQIAERKFLTPGAVQIRLAEARTRTGARSLAHLCSLCVEHGLLERNGHGFKPVQRDGVIGE